RAGSASATGHNPAVRYHPGLAAMRAYADTSFLVKLVTAALARIERWLKRGRLTEAAAECDEALLQARRLSEKHTERLGCRSFDLLHIALAVGLRCDVFLTSD